MLGGRGARVMAATVSTVRNGLLAGICGTVAMDAVWYSRYIRGGGSSPVLKWEFSSSTTGFDDAPAPAKVGRKLASTAHVELPDSLAGATNNVVHWATGLSWGVAAAALRPIPRVGSLRAGLGAAVAAFATSYAVLPKLDIYKPITEYDAKTLWKDFSAHVVFGAATGAGLAVTRRLLK